jgi:CpeT protein
MRLLLLPMLSFIGCASSSASVVTTPRVDVAAQLYQALQGSFDSSAQAAADPEYKTIHLVICAADARDLGERVLYVEQAAAEARNKPYRQRLYVVQPAGPSQAISRVFELKDPASSVGACERGRPRFNAAQAEERVGCGVTLALAADGTLAGGTEGQKCASTLRGASYATSQVRLDAKVLTSWDQGFDATGAQVWGAVKGPYAFVRAVAGPH